MYPVDWDYFSEVIEQNKDSAGIEWYFGCFNGDDLERIQMFIQRFNIDWDRVYIFRTDTISVKLLPEKATVPEKNNISRKKSLVLLIGVIGMYGRVETEWMLGMTRGRLC